MKALITVATLPFFFLVLISPIYANTTVTYGFSLHGFNHLKALIVEQSNVEWVRSDIVYNGSWFVGDKGDCINYRDYNQKILGIIDYWTMNQSKTWTFDDWSNRVNETVYHYGAKIEAYEIWNEPNVYEYQTGYLNDTNAINHYFNMLKNASQIIKGYNETLIVVGGVFSDIYDYPAGDNWETWFTSLLDLGANQYVDVWSIHLYAGQLEAYAIDRIHDLSGKPVWVTETGYKASEGEDLQALWLENRLENIQEGNNLPQIVMVYELYGEYGLIDANYSKREAYHIFLSYSYPKTPTPTIWYRKPENVIVFVIAVVLGLYFFKKFVGDKVIW